MLTSLTVLFIEFSPTITSMLKNWRESWYFCSNYVFYVPCLWSNLLIDWISLFPPFYSARTGHQSQRVIYKGRHSAERYNTCTSQEKKDIAKADPIRMADCTFNVRPGLINKWSGQCWVCQTRQCPWELAVSREVECVTEDPCCYISHVKSSLSRPSSPHWTLLPLFLISLISCSFTLHTFHYYKAEDIE